MKLRSVNEILPETRVILKLDLDLPMADGVVTDNSRLLKSLPTIRLLLEKKCRLAIIGKLGRPDGHDPELSLRPVYLELMSLLEPGEENLIDSIFVEDISNLEKLDTALVNNQIIFLENLRYWKGEENNDPDFLRPLVEVSQFFVNDALAVSHRHERSNLLYKNLPGFYGLAFIDEVEKILQVVQNPIGPITVILGGAKEDKLNYLPELEKIADHILIGGKLPQLISNQNLNPQKVIVAKLRADGLDLSEADITNFGNIIQNSKIIIWAGAMGFFEKENCQEGTRAIAIAVANSQAYKIIAGGDTGASIKDLGLENKIDLIASGGGVMLELLTRGTLPAWN